MKRLFLLTFIALLFLSWNGAKAQDPCYGEDMWCGDWLYPSLNTYTYQMDVHCSIIITYRYKYCTNPDETYVEIYDAILTGDCTGYQITDMLKLAYQALLETQPNLFVNGYSSKIVTATIASCWEQFYNQTGISIPGGLPDFHYWYVPCQGSACCYVSYTEDQYGNLTNPSYLTTTTDCNNAIAPSEFNLGQMQYTFPAHAGNGLDNQIVMVSSYYPCQPVCTCLSFRIGNNALPNKVDNIILDYGINNIIKYSIYTSEASDFEISINDLTGRQIENFKENASNGYNFFEKDCSDYSIGTYFFNVYQNGILVKSIKFLVL